MERFVKINKQVKNNLFKICRLCGIDNPNKVGILEEVVFLSDDGEIEPPLYKKIFNCVGIQVTPSDQMPKTICALCFDKINDFHEFREMCYVTNVQTRKLLGLSEQPKLELKWEQGQAVINPVVPPKKDISENKKTKTEKKAKKRKNAEPPLSVNEPKQVKLENNGSIKSEVKIEDEIVTYKINKKVKAKLDKTIKSDVSKLPIPKPKNDKKNKIENAQKGKQDKLKVDKAIKPVKQEPRMIMCQICQTTFASAALLQSHLLKLHVPSIDRYFCVKCSEKIEETMEIKSHNLWHKLSKTPYQCGRCDKEINSLQGLTRHIRECHLVPRGIQINILPNVICKLCSVEFQTKNLFFMHSCITGALQCPKCKCKLSNQSNTLKHIATCNAKIRNEEEMNYIIKDEPLDICPLVPPPLPLADSPVPLAILPSPSISKSKVSKNLNQQTAQLTAAPILKEGRNSRASHTMVVIPSSSTVQASDSDTKDPSKNQTSSTIKNTDPNSLKANGKKQKEEAMMARCSVLLQDTLRTLVNIKQEPIETQNVQTNLEKPQPEANENEIQIENFPTPHIKQEVLDENYKEVESNLEINIKQEIITYPTISQPPLPALKLKIKKEHGTLNSSFIANMGNDTSLLESQKKKKVKTSKKKNKETEKLTSEDELKSSSTEELESSSISEKTTPTNDKDKLDFPQPVLIKTERIDPEYEVNDDFNNADDFHTFDDYNSADETGHPVGSNGSSLPVIANIQSGTDPLRICQQNSTTLLKISSISSGTEALEKIQSKVTEEKQISKETENFDPIRTNGENENSDQLTVKENIISLPNENNSLNSLMPQIVAVSSGVALPLKNSEENVTQANISTCRINSEGDVPMLQISEVSSGIHLEKSFQEEGFDYTDVVIKEEPDFGDYLEQAQEILPNNLQCNNGKDVENYDVDENNINGSTGEESFDEFEDDSYEESEDHLESTLNENPELQEKLDVMQLKDIKTKKNVSNKTKKKLKKKKLANNNKLPHSLKSRDLEIENLNCPPVNESQYNNNMPLEENVNNKLMEINNPVTETEILFDPNIKIKQEIEFTEETFVEDDQYEYGSDNGSYEDDYTCNEFSRFIKSPSPIKELQPIIMDIGINNELISTKLNLNNFVDSNNGKNEAFNVNVNDDIELNKNDCQEGAQNLTEGTCKESFESENFGFKKIKLNMFLNTDTQNSFAESNIKSVPENNLFEENQSILGLQISSVAHLPENDASNENIQTTNTSDCLINSEISGIQNQIPGDSECIAVNASNTIEHATLSSEVNEQFAIRLPKLENINEIAENHNNENFEKMLRNELVENENECAREDIQYSADTAQTSLTENINPKETDNNGSEEKGLNSKDDSNTKEEKDLNSGNAKAQITRPDEQP